VTRLFGTDGIRGVANVDSADDGVCPGRAVAHHLVGVGGAIVIGQDTRRSGDMFVSAIAAGAASLGVVPTWWESCRPALAYLAGSARSRPGSWCPPRTTPPTTMASGLDSAGLKLDEAIEDELERLIWRTEELGASATPRWGGR
jgi:phosphoglucosamine mutase